MEWIAPAVVVPFAYALSGYFQKLYLKRGRSSEFVLSFTFLFFISLLVMSAFIGIDPPDHWVIPLIYLNSWFGALGQYSIIKGLRRGDLSRVSPYMGMSPILVLILSTALIGEVISLVQLTGIILVVIGAISLETNLFREWPRIDNVLGFVTLGIFLYSISAVMDKYLLGFVKPFTYLTFVTGFIFVDYLLLFRKNPISLIRADKKHSLWYLVLAVLFILVSRGSQVVAVSLGPVSAVIAIKRTSSIISVILGGKILREENLIERLISTAIVVLGAMGVLLG